MQHLTTVARTAYNDCLQNATHVRVDESVKIIPAELFYEHKNIVELICHDGVIKIEAHAFWKCPRLRRVIILGVKVVEYGVFYNCEAVEYVECPKLEIIGVYAFGNCKSLRIINLPSAKVVDEFAFDDCDDLTEARFGEALESFRRGSFDLCRSLERITIPLKNGLFTRNSTFRGASLKRVDLVERAVLHETIATLLLEEWRNDMNAVIDSINQILPNAPAGYYEDEDDYDHGEKALVIREWISRVLDKVIDYKSQHRRLVNKAASSLQRALPNDIVTNSVIPFLSLPIHAFDGEDEEEDIDNSHDGSEYTSEEEDADGREEDEDGDDSHDQLEDASVGEEGDDVSEQQQHQDDEGRRKRRKTANGDKEEVDD